MSYKPTSNELHAKLEKLVSEERAARQRAREIEKELKQKLNSSQSTGS